MVPLSRLKAGPTAQAWDPGGSAGQACDVWRAFTRRGWPSQESRTGYTDGAGQSASAKDTGIVAT